MTKHNSYRTGPDAEGRFGKFGGRFVAETLMPLVLALEKEYGRAKKDSKFKAELEYYLCGQTLAALFCRTVNRVLPG